MFILNFIKKLLPHTNKVTVQEDLEISQRELSDMVIPSYTAAETYFRLNKGTSQGYKGMEARWRHAGLVRGSSQVFLTAILVVLEQYRANVAQLQGWCDQHFQDDILSAGLSGKQIYLLRSASTLSTLNRYLLSLLNYLYTVEAEHNGTSLQTALTLPKAELGYVEKGFDRFMLVLKMYAHPAADFAKTFEAISEDIVDPESSTATKYLESNILSASSAPIQGLTNPIYLLRLPFAKWQNDRYQAAKDKKQQLELRLLHLKLQREGKSDPALDKEISQLQDRINSYERYVREVEESVGV